MQKNILKGCLLSGFGSLWWGVIGVLYFKSVSFVSPLELTIHRTIWTALLLVISISFFSQWSHVLNIVKNCPRRSITTIETKDSLFERSFIHV